MYGRNTVSASATGRRLFAKKLILVLIILAVMPTIPNSGFVNPAAVPAILNVSVSVDPTATPAAAPATEPSIDLTAEAVSELQSEQVIKPPAEITHTSSVASAAGLSTETVRTTGHNAETDVELPATAEINGNVITNNSLPSDNSTAAELVPSSARMDEKTIDIPVTISRPSENIRTSYTHYYLNGASDPTKPLYLNGRPVENRSRLGYFGILVPLQEGENIFTLSQDTSIASRVIHRITPAPPKPMEAPEIPKSSVFPQSQHYCMPGEKITLSCIAPTGAKVFVTLNGNKYPMEPGDPSQTPSLYPTTYNYAYTVPEYTGTPRIIDLGAPVYSINYEGTVKTQKAANIGVIMKGAPYYAEVARDMIFTYKETSTDSGGIHELYKGMVDYITGMSGRYVRLSTGQYVLENQVNIKTTRDKEPVILSVEYSTAHGTETLKLNIDKSPAAYITFDGDVFKIHISARSMAEVPNLPETSLFSSVNVSSHELNTVYTLILKENTDIHGYYMEKTTNGLEFIFRHRVFGSGGDKPLNKITIMIDPGHGGSEPGAIGPLGLKYAEKDINLKNGLKLKAELESLGAKVLMTRTADKTVSLTERLNQSRAAKPDLFISIHSDSMPDNVDISQYFGISTFYREAHARLISEEICNYTASVLNRKNRGVKVRNFYVIRGTWTPSMLIECGFVPNPAEFEWLTDEKEQQKLMKTIAEAIVNYFCGNVPIQ